MRLIDADEQFCEEASDGTGYVLAYAGGIYAVTNEFGHTVCEFLPEQPTVAAAPVVHGRWKVIKYEDDGAYYVRCEKCGYEYSSGHIAIPFVGMPEEEPYFHNYCPECGTKMVKKGT